MPNRMTVLEIVPGGSIQIGPGIVVTFIKRDSGQRARLGFTAPPGTTIVRNELTTKHAARAAL